MSSLLVFSTQAAAEASTGPDAAARKRSYNVVVAKASKAGGMFSRARTALSRVKVRSYFLLPNPPTFFLPTFPTESCKAPRTADRATITHTPPARAHQVPDGYEVTYLTMLEGTRRVLEGDAPVGFQTPALAFGEGILEATLGEVAWHDE